MSNGGELFEQLRCLPGFYQREPSKSEFRKEDGSVERNNGHRAEAAATTLDVYVASERLLKEPKAEALQDLVTNLLHLAHSVGEDPTTLLSLAISHFIEETHEAAPLPALASPKDLPRVRGHPID